MPAIVALLLALLLSMPGQAHAVSPRAVTSIAPLAWLLGQTGGDAVSVDVLVPQGHVPESSQPAPRSLARLHDASLVLLVGHPSFTFETRLVRPLLSRHQRSRLIDLYAVAISIYPAQVIDDGDPHLWTSPRIMRAAIDPLVERLVLLDPGHAGTYRQRGDELKARIDARIRGFEELARRRPSRRFLVYHPAWGGLARDFGLEQVAIEQEGKIPGPARLARLFDDMADTDRGVIIVSPGHARRDAELMARQHGLRVVVVDPLARDWFAMMDEMRQALDND